MSRTVHIDEPGVCLEFMLNPGRDVDDLAIKVAEVLAAAGVLRPGEGVVQPSTAALVEVGPNGKLRGEDGVRAGPSYSPLGEKERRFIERYGSQAPPHGGILQRGKESIELDFTTKIEPEDFTRIMNDLMKLPPDPGKLSATPKKE